MTYCIGLSLKTGLVLLSDTRTNAGIDNISVYKKTFTWQTPGDRVIAMMVSGNLAVTQAVISLLQENIDHPKDGIENILQAESMFRIAEIVGNAMVYVQNRYAQGITATGESPSATICVAGQRAGGRPRMFMVYAAGNFIETTEDTPYFQMGEHKYGKPILDRVVSYETSLEAGVKVSLVSMDSTLRSNLSVGMPLDLTVIPKDSLDFLVSRRIEPDDPKFLAMSNQWSESMRASFAQIGGDFMDAN